MNRLHQSVILTRLARKLRAKGSWCGETHMQKAIYLFQELLTAPTQFDFVLYKHGPFSFDLRDELTALRADGLLELELQPMPYGPRLAPTDRAQVLEGVLAKTVARQERKLDFVAAHCGDKGVMELEKLATALYVTRHPTGRAAVDARAKRLHVLKPHIPLEQATAAVQEADRVLAEAKKFAAA
jgi:uncharacterized protein YwgA